MAKKKETRIGSVKEALKITGEKMPKFTGMSKALKLHYESDFIWKTIVAALNKQRDPNWICDFMNEDQDKNYPYAILKKDPKKKTGFGFSGSDYNYTHTDTHVGSRLRFAHSDDVIYALKTFEQEYIASVIY